LITFGILLKQYFTPFFVHALQNDAHEPVSVQNKLRDPFDPAMVMSGTESKIWTGSNSKQKIVG